MAVSLSLIEGVDLISTGHANYNFNNYHIVLPIISRMFCPLSPEQASYCTATSKSFVLAVESSYEV